MGFENLPREKRVSASIVLHANAQVLIDTGKQAAKAANFGLGRSLLILGAEEYIKGCILYLSGIGIKVYEVKEAKQALRNHHKVRHEVAMLFKMLKIVEGVANVKRYKPLNQAKSTWWGSIPHYMSQASELFSVIRDVGEDLEWWEKANDYKNDGIYGDYKSGLVTPSSITKEDFDISFANVSSLIKGFRGAK